MTVTATDAIAGPYTGNDVTTSFPFSFRILEDSHLRVFLTDDDGVDGADLVLDTDYSVAGAGDPSGTVTYPVSGDPLPTGWKLTILRDVPLSQAEDIANAGAFYPEVHERVFDKITMMVQQIKEETGRAVKVSASSDTDPDDLIAEVTAAAGVVGGVLEDAEAVAASINAVFLGAKAADPTLDNDGNALVAGACYFNTVSGVLKVYNGAAWLAATPTNISVDRFSGTGAQTAFTLSSAPGSANATIVAVSGVYQQKNTYTVVGTTLTFSTAPALGTDNIEVSILGLSQSIGTPSDGTVTAAKIVDNSVTTAKILDSAVTTAKIADGNVTGAKLGAITSAQLRSALTDESGTGAALFGTGPTIDAPTVTGEAQFSLLDRFSATLTKTSDTAFASIPGMSWAVTAGVTYALSIFGYISQLAAGGNKTQYSGPAMTSWSMHTKLYNNSGGLLTNAIGTAIGSTGVTSVTGVLNAFEGIVTFTPSANGTVALQGAQQVSNATATSFNGFQGILRKLS